MKIKKLNLDWFKNKENLGTIVLLLLLVYPIIDLHLPFLNLLPSYLHTWTQSDRFAIALGYLENNFNLFLPTQFNLSTKDGIIGVDLPIHEYVIAIIMKVLGTKEPFVFRYYQLVLSISAIVIFFRSILKWNKNIFISLMISLFVVVTKVT